MRAQLLGALAALALWSHPADASGLGEVSVGAGAGLFLVDDQTTYGDNAREILDNLGGDLRAEHTRSASWMLSQGLRLNRFVELQIRERYWALEIEGRFDHIEPLSYRYRRQVVPVNLLPRLTLDGERIGLRLGAGPGLYWVQTDRRGWLGNGSDDELALGLVVEVALAIHVADDATLELSWQHDSVAFEQTDALLSDYGRGGGTTFQIAATIHL